MFGMVSFDIDVRGRSAVAVSNASSSLSDGRLVGSRLACIDLPVHGGPMRSALWQTAAAISSARFTDP